MPEYKKFMTLRKAFTTFKTNFDKWVYGKILSNKNVKDETLGQDDVRKKAWDFIIDLELYKMFPESYEYELEKHIPMPWDDGMNETHKKRYINKYQRRWRQFKEAFEFLVEYGSERLKKKEDEQIQIAGVNILIKNKQEENEKTLKKYISHFKKVVAQVKKAGMGKALQGLQMNINFDVSTEQDIYATYGDLVGGSYSPDKDQLNIFPLGMGRRIDDDTFIHEIGHRYWYRHVPERAKDAWEKKINQRVVKVDIDHIDKFMKLYYRDEYESFQMRKDIEKDIEKNIEDPTEKLVFTYLSKNTPLFDVKDGDTKTAYREFLIKRAKGEEIPLEWITDYGRTNPVEAFAEAFKLWIGGSKGKLGEWTRAWFKNIVAKGGVNIKEEKELIEKYI